MVVKMLTLNFVAKITDGCFCIQISAIVYAMRLNLSVAVVSMTTEQPVKLANGTTTRVKEFDWNSKQKGYLLSSFFYGYVLSEFPGGWLSKRFGGATILGLVVMCSSVSTLLLPFVAEQGLMVIIIFRAIVGIFEGGSYPSTYTIYSRWAPSEEKSQLLALALTGPHMAMTICNPIYGILARYLGWRSIFFVSGSAGLLWVVMWFKEVKNEPKDDPKITENELRKIQSSVGDNHEGKVKCPWKQIFTSLPVWANIVSNFCECWGYFTMFTELPTFLNDVYKFDVHDVGLLSGIPYTVACVGLPLTGKFVDHFRKTKGYSTTFVRKLYNSFCYYSQAVCIALIVFSPSTFYTMFLLVLWMGFGCFAIGGSTANYLDIAPPYAGVIMGISNTIGCLAAAICPTVAGYIVSNKTKAEWNIVFLLCSVIYIFGATFFLIFASGEVQEWAKIPVTTKDENNEETKNKDSDQLHRHLYS